VPWTGDRNEAIQSLAAELRGQGKNVFMVPYGVSSPLGAVGYASAVVEIADQSRAAGFDPAAIVHRSGSGGTQAGLCVGASIALKNTRIVGIDIYVEPARVRAEVLSRTKAAADLLGVALSESEIEVVAGHAGIAYGVPHTATIEAIKLAGALEGLVLDPVYTGKGLAGLIALVRAGRWRSGEHIVLMHTGGMPALFAYESVLGI
jgi:L-cysteate sulfo-lyase